MPSAEPSTPLVPPSPPSASPALAIPGLSQRLRLEESNTVDGRGDETGVQAQSELDLLAFDPKTGRIVPAQRRARPWLWHQPQKGVLIVAWIASCVLLAPYWAIAALCGQRPRRTWSVKRCVQVRFIRRVTWLIAKTGFDTGGRDLSVAPDPTRLRKSTFVWAEHGDIWAKVQTGFVREAAKINEVGAVRVPIFRYPREPPSKPVAQQRVVMTLHGGAYWLGTAHEKDFHSRICLGLVDVSGYDRVFAVDYRLVVQQPFPAALIDALVAYQHLLDVEGYRPDQITICGDSAGGNLALALARLLRDTSTLPLPGALLLLSPWCDPSFSYRLGEHRSFKTNYESDIVDVSMTPAAVQYLLGSLPTAANQSPYISPITTNPRVFKEAHVTFDRFPPTCIVMSEAERLWDEGVELKARMEECSVAVHYVADADAVHDWLQFTFMEPNRTRSLQKIRDWREKLGSVQSA